MHQDEGSEDIMREDDMDREEYENDYYRQTYRSNDELNCGFGAASSSQSDRYQKDLNRYFEGLIKERSEGF